MRSDREVAENIDNNKMDEHDRNGGGHDGTKGSRRRRQGKGKRRRSAVWAEEEDDVSTRMTSKVDEMLSTKAYPKSNLTKVLMATPSKIVSTPAARRSLQEFPNSLPTDHPESKVIFDVDMHRSRGHSTWYDLFMTSCSRVRLLMTSRTIGVGSITHDFL